MAKFQGGLKEIVKAVQLMNTDERKTLISSIAKQNPEMAQKISKSLFSLDSLSDISPQMFVAYLLKVKIEDLALALKLYPVALQEEVMSRVSSRNSDLIKEILEGEKLKLSLVQEAESRVLVVFREMIDNGELIISSDDQLV